MFRAAQANPFDDAVVKATDENHTQENWALIIDVCDKVGAEETGGKDAVAAMIKRLAHRNANVQLYTLELANALSQNCGIKIHKELASRSFTDALLRLANDRNTHQQVKARILERMTDWAEMFSSNPDLGIMEQAYTRLKSQNPSLAPPSKPFKREITDVDRQKEEEELQMALALSIKDKPSQQGAQQQSQGVSSTVAASSSQEQPSPLVVTSGTTAATVSRVRALFDFQPSEPGELQFRKGDIIAVLESVYKDWWKGSLRGLTGIFPLNYVEKLQDPTQEELQREAQMEAEVFAEIKNVEKLLTLLSTSSSDMNVRDNEEITTLYHSTLSIRPKLIDLISKYSQKKDDFTQLNEKFIKARRDYESLLEESMSHPTQVPYGRPPQGSAYGYGGGSGPPQGQGYPTSQQDPQRFYAPPQGQQEANYPPREGPAPFYMIPPSQQGQVQQPQQQQQYPPSQHASAPKPVSPDPYAQQGPSQNTERPGSLYSRPQELAASNFDPPQPHHQPVQQRPYSPPQAQQYQNIPNQGYQQQESTYPPQDTSYHQTYTQQSQYTQQPSHAPPPQPTSQPPLAPTQSPPPGQTSHLAPHGNPDIPAALQHGGYQQPPNPAYQAYQPGGRPAMGVGGGPRSEADASDFYR